MATFKENPDLVGWKKIEYKNGIVKAAFQNGDGQVIECKGGEMPHPDFRSQFALLSRFAKVILCTNALTVEATAIEYPEPGSLRITANIRTDYITAEVKTKPILYEDIEEWDEFAQATDENTGEVMTLLDLAKNLNDETRAYLFQGKNAQQKIDFPELKHDGMDGARALLKITGTND